jgi:hypothetical protein
LGVVEVVAAVVGAAAAAPPRGRVMELLLLLLLGLALGCHGPMEAAADGRAEPARARGARACIG